MSESAKIQSSRGELAGFLFSGVRTSCCCRLEIGRAVFGNRSFSIFGTECTSRGLDEEGRDTTKQRFGKITMTPGNDLKIKVT